MRPCQITPNEALILFTGKTDLGWLRLFLRDGFRHCAAVLHDGQQWIKIDPMAHITKIEVSHASSDFDMIGWMKDQDFHVVKAPIVEKQVQAPFGVFSCVEVIKRIIGLHQPFIITPWQLYNHLKGESNGIAY